MAGSSYGERRKKKIEKQKAREERRSTQYEKKILLTEADLKDMNFEQKLWVYVRTFFIAGWPFILYLFMPAVCMALGRMLLYVTLYKNGTEEISDALHFYTFCGIVLTLYILHKSAKSKGSALFKEAGLSFENLKWKTIGKLFLFGFLISGMISAILSLIPDRWMTSYDEATTSMFSGYDTLFSFICLLVLTPLAEEIVFRGYLLRRLKPLFKRTKSIWIVSILFALCHMSLVWIIYGTIIGFVMAFLADRYDNTAYSLALHIGFNIFTLVNYIVSGIPNVSDVLFGHKWLFIIYAAVFAIPGYFLFIDYCKKEQISLRKNRG